jgi:hypothetical protein
MPLAHTSVVVVRFLRVLPVKSRKLRSIYFYWPHFFWSVFAASGVQLAQTDRGQFHFRRTDFDSHLKSRIGLALTKVEALRITSNLDGTPITSKSHTYPSHSQTSCLLTSSLSLGVPVPRATHNKQPEQTLPVITRVVNDQELSAATATGQLILKMSSEYLSSHRHSYRS